MKKHFPVLIIIAILALPFHTQAQNKKLTFEDIMKWEDISDAVISYDGAWLAYSVWPDRGDGEVRIRNMDGNTMYSIPLGEKPEITSTGNWVGAYLKPKLEDQIKSKKKKPEQGLALLNTSNGKMAIKDSVDAYQFSNDGQWIAVQFYPPEKTEKEDEKKEPFGTEMLLRNLETGLEYRVPFVKEMSFDSTSNYIAYSVLDTTGTGNGLYYRNLEASPSRQRKIVATQDALFANLSWDDINKRLAFTEAAMDTTFETEDAFLKVWNASNDQTKTLIDPSEVDKKWTLRTNNDIEWTDDGNRLFFGLMPRSMVNIIQRNEIQRNKKEEKTDSVDVYDQQQILDEKELDVWHYNDPRIKPHAKKTWDRRKERTYRAVFHMKEGKWVQLADRKMPEVEITQNPDVALGSSSVPYLKAVTWDGSYSDYYIVDL